MSKITHDLAIGKFSIDSVLEVMLREFESLINKEICSNKLYKG